MKNKQEYALSSVFLTNSTAEAIKLRMEEKTYRLATAAAIMLSWLLIWALVLKCGSEMLLLRNYQNLKDMTVEERILWDIIPFNYRGDDSVKRQLFVDSVLNCFVFVPLGICICLAARKRKALRTVLFCLGYSVFVEFLQLLTTLGNPATEDLITNLFGALLAIALYYIIFNRISPSAKLKLLAVTNILLALSVILSALTTVGAFDVIYGIATKTL